MRAVGVHRDNLKPPSLVARLEDCAPNKHKSRSRVAAVPDRVDVILTLGTRNARKSGLVGKATNALEARDFRVVLDTPSCATDLHHTRGNVSEMSDGMPS